MPSVLFALNFENKTDMEVLMYCRNGTIFYLLLFGASAFQLVEYFVRDVDYLEYDQIEINATILSLGVAVLLLHCIMFFTTFWKECITSKDMRAAFYSLLAGSLVSVCRRIPISSRFLCLFFLLLIASAEQTLIPTLTMWTHMNRSVLYYFQICILCSKVWYINHWIHHLIYSARTTAPFVRNSCVFAEIRSKGGKWSD